jgi:hypothetical protein
LFINLPEASSYQRASTCKINGEKFSFKVDVDSQGMKMKFNYKGILKGDEVELSFITQMEGGGPGMGSSPPQSFTVKRLK